MSADAAGRHYPPDARHLLASQRCGCGATYSSFTFAAATLGNGPDAYTSYIPEPRVECPECLAPSDPGTFAVDWTDAPPAIDTADRRFDTAERRFDTDN